MAKIKIDASTTGTGTFTISAPNSNTDRTLTLPDTTASLVTTASPDFTGDVTFDTSTLVIDSTNNRVGIGTSSPTVPLHVDGSVRLDHASGEDFYIYRNASSDMTLGLGSSNAAIKSIATIAIMPEGTSVQKYNFTSNVFHVNGPSVGIGTSSPAGKLHIAGSSSTDFDGLTIRNGSGTTGSAAVLGFEASSGTLGDDASLAGQIKGVREGSGTNGALSFWTSNNGVPTERMRIDYNGNVKFHNHLGIGADPHSTRPLRVSQDATNEWIAEFINTGTSPYGVYIDTSANSSTAAAFQIYANSGGGIKIRNDSLVGIGTSNPDTKLHIAADNGNAEVEVLRLTNSDNTFTNGETEQAISLGFELNASEAGVREDRLAAKIVARKGGSGGNDWFTNGASTNFQGQLDFYTRKDDVLTKQMTLNEGGVLQYNSGFGSVTTAYGVRAWINWNGNGSTINGSGGVSSYTRAGTGDYDINWSTTMPDANYAVTCCSGESRIDRGLTSNGLTTTKVTMNYENTSGTRVDASPLMIIVVR